MEDAATIIDIAEAAAQRRFAKRQRVLKAAKIVLDDWRALDCQLRDVSQTGAKIRVDNVTMVPHKFRLYFASDNSIRDVQVAWKHNDQIGVAFVGPAKSCALRKF
jgi:2-succinyl-5-enolpyruvyl-6-hydroxy-3-cyclohexene-1-carboxylate synthase